MTQIPTNMKAVVRSSDPKKIVEVSTLPVPKADKGEVIVRVEAASVNPSDEIFAFGGYGVPGQIIAKPPITIGFEGSGVVVSLGSEVPDGLMNQRVAFSTNPQGKEKWSGSWGQYICVDHKYCVPIGDLSFEDTCEFFINPITVQGFILEAKIRKSKGIVHTAAASSLGKMLVKLCIKNNLELINVIRRDEQGDLLKKLGAKHVLNQNDPDFIKKLKELASKLEITLCFDAVGGSLTGKLLSAMPPKSSVLNYGALDDNLISGFNPVDFIFLEKKVEGFWLTTSPIFSPEELPKAIGAVLADLKSSGGIFKPIIAKRIKMEECSDHLLNHGKHPTEGKTILLPNAK